MEEKNYQKMMEQYPILFCQRNGDCMETCMCWGIEAGIGWYEPLNKLCSCLEELNHIYYPKYRLRIQADQVKEKYGELRFYYSIRSDRNIFYKSYYGFFKKIHDIINKIDFKKETKIIEPKKTEEKWCETVERCYNNADEENRKKENDKFYIKQNVCIPAKTEEIILNHKWLYKIKESCYNVYYKSKCPVEINEKQKEIAGILSSIVDALIEKCENKCWNTCEWCGKDGGFNGENLITTSGWISRICRECSQNSIQNRLKKDNENYVPAVLSFTEGYDFLNAYQYSSFTYNKNNYHSIAEAFYMEKDKRKHHSIFKIVFRCFKNLESFKELIKLIVKLLKIKINKKDFDLMKEVIKARFNKENKQILIKFSDYDLHNFTNDCDNLFGECLCSKCKSIKNKGMYVKALKEVIKEYKNDENN